MYYYRKKNIFIVDFEQVNESWVSCSSFDSIHDSTNIWLHYWNKNFCSSRKYGSGWYYYSIITSINLGNLEYEV